MNAVEVSRLSFAYAEGVRALDDVSFVVAEGECVGLIGPNGAGKSTLLLHLNGLLPERIGNGSPVRVFGDPICRDRLYRVRREVGLLFQNPDDQLFCPTVFEDVAFGPQQYGREGADLKAEVGRALTDVGLPDFAGRAPHHLSQGEKRRVCLAGLLVCSPRLLLLDEPTGDLDPRGRRELKTLLRQLPITKIVASHDLEMIAELCSRVVVLNRGRVVAEGPAADTLSNEALMLAHGLERPHILHHLQDGRPMLQGG